MVSRNRNGIVVRVCKIVVLEYSKEAPRNKC